MRLNCPLCGVRDSREFTYRGSAGLMERPDQAVQFHEYLHLRDNPAGQNAELWHHALGCSAWLRVERDTVTHDILKVELASEARP